MVLFLLSPTRILSVYLAQGLIAVFFAFLAYKTLKQGRGRVNIIFSSFYFSIITGLFINFIYAPLEEPETMIILNKLTNFSLSIGPAFLTLFCLVFYFGEENFNTLKQGIYIVSYALILVFLMFFIPDGVTINAETYYMPLWSPIYFIFVFLALIIYTYIPLMFYSLKIFKRFDDELLKHKWKFFIFGINILFFLLCGTFFVSVIPNLLVKFIWAIIMIFFAFSGGYLVYYGYAKKF